jgi:hypothetical protein
MVSVTALYIFELLCYLKKHNLHAIKIRNYMNTIIEEKMICMSKNAIQ